MFLFRRKKENPEVKAEEVKAEVKKTAAPPVKVVDKSAKQTKAVAQAKTAPVQVKDPATSKVAIEVVKNADELADSLLVKVEPNPEVENAVDDAVVAAVLKPVVMADASPGAASATPVLSVKTETSQAEKPAVPEANLPTPAVVPEKPVEIKPVAAISPVPAETPKPPAAPEIKPAENAQKAAPAEEKGDLFSNLFGKSEVEEETHLDRLIKSLPDVGIEEVINEADEVKNLMNEWFQSQNR
jgi:hypothetical protein